MNAVITQGSALIQTYMECRGELTQFLGRRTGCLSLAADLVNDLYLKLMDLKEPDLINNRRAYLFTMVANLARDHERVESRRQVILEENNSLMWMVANEPCPEHSALIHAELQCVFREMNSLSRRCQKVLYLSRYEEKTQVEIAAELGIGVTTVFKDLKMAMAVLNQIRVRFYGT